MANQITVAEFLTQAIHISGKTQKEISEEAGLPRANFLSMMKQGVTRVPIDRIPGLAKACGVDPVRFLRLAMIEYENETWNVLQRSFGESLSDDEKTALEKYRAERDAVLEKETEDDEVTV